MSRRSGYRFAEQGHAPGIAAAGQKIGLLGGSFDPPHAAHRAISLLALKRLGLDQVWWLVTPGNPLKDTGRLPSLADRIAAARKIARHPAILVTDLEARIGTRFSDDTVRWLLRAYPRAKFVWLMGADNLAGFHRWRNWRAMAGRIPIAVVDRAGASLRATASPAGGALARYRLPEAAARRLADSRPPAWVFLHGLKSPLSSTELRGARC